MSFPHHDPFYCPASAIATNLNLPIIPMRDYETVSFTLEVTSASSLDCKFAIFASNVNTATKARFALTNFSLDITEDGVYHIEAPLTCLGAYLACQLSSGSGQVIITALAKD